MNIELLFAFRSLKMISEVPAQQQVQQSALKKSYRKLLIERRDRNRIYDFLYFAELIRLFLFAISKLKIHEHDTKIAFLIAAKNHISNMDYIKELFPNSDFLTFEFYNARSSLHVIRHSGALLAAIMTALQYYRHYRRKHDFIELANNVSFLCHYVFLQRVFKKYAPRVAVTANDHSPVPLAFMAAARCLNIKTAYIQHSHIPVEIPRLRFDLAILDGKCAEDIYKLCGPHSGETVFRGVEGPERSMQTVSLSKNRRLTMGLFLNVFYEDKLMEIIRVLENNDRISQVLIRRHPGIPVEISLAGLSKTEISPLDQTLWQDAERCDLVIGGNSSFHLSVLKYGVPTAYLHGLDFIKHDEYEFVKNDICYEIKSLENMDFKDIASFYAAPEWTDRFRYFDPSYARDRTVIDRSVKAALERLY